MTQAKDLLQNLDGLTAAQLRRMLTEHLTKQKLGLCWEASAIERDTALTPILCCHVSCGARIDANAYETK